MADFRSAEKHATLEMLLLAPYLLKECHRLLSTVVKYHSTRQDTHLATFCPVSFCCTQVSSLIHENYRFLDVRQLDVTDVERSGRCHVKMSSATSRIWRFASRIDGNGIPSYRSMRCNLRWQMAKVNSARVFPGHVRTSFVYANSLCPNDTSVIFRSNELFFVSSLSPEPQLLSYERNISGNSDNWSASITSTAITIWGVTARTKFFVTIKRTLAELALSEPSPRVDPFRCANRSNNKTQTAGTRCRASRSIQLRNITCYVFKNKCFVQSSYTNSYQLNEKSLLMRTPCISDYINKLVYRFVEATFYQKLFVPRQVWTNAVPPQYGS